MSYVENAMQSRLDTLKDESVWLVIAVFDRFNGVETDAASTRKKAEKIRQEFINQGAVLTTVVHRVLSYTIYGESDERS